MNRRGNTGLALQRAFLAAILLGASWIGTIAPNPPSPVPSHAPLSEFSAERAFAHVKAIAQKPHPIGSEENAEVRRYIASQFKELGVPCEEQSFQAQIGGRDVTGVNLLARVAGTTPTNSPSSRALALVCHYDSVPAGPGAADDGAGVATLLETARAIKHGSSQGNDILFLFTDGEEANLLGARAFVTNSPQAKEIGLVLNFEARGVSGPVLMFETSAGNGKLVAEVAKAAPRPAANSLMYEVYRRMPNDTDLTVFRRAGVAGMNFAFIAESQHYHRMTDDPEHLSPASLQHMGSYALSLARHFGNFDLNTLNAPDAVYFDLFGRMLVHYPGKWVLPLVFTAIVFFLIVTSLAIRRRQASFRRILLAAAAVVAQAMVVGFLFRYLVSFRGVNRIPSADWSFWYVAVGLTITIVVTSHLLLRRWSPPVNLALGAQFLWLILAMATALWMPGASYLLMWPLVFAQFGLLCLLWPKKERCWSNIMLLAFSGIPASLLIAPLVHDFYVALGSPGVLVPMVLLALLLNLLSSQIDAIFNAQSIPGTD